MYMDVLLMCMYVRTIRVPGAQRGQKRVSNSLEIEFQVFVVWVLVTKSGSYRTAVSILNPSGISRAPEYSLKAETSFFSSICKTVFTLLSFKGKILSGINGLNQK